MKCLLLFGFITIAVAAIPKPDPRQCNAPNNGGLNGIIDMILVHQNEFFGVLLEYAVDDDQVRNIIEFLQSNEFSEMLHELEKQEAFISLVQIACNDLYLDVVYYYNKMAIVLDFPLIHIHIQPQPKKVEGLVGMFNQMAEVLHIPEFHKNLEETSKTDKYLQKALKFFLSEEFKNKVTAFTALIEYNVFIQKMYERGVDIDKIDGFVNDHFEKLESYVKNA